MTVTGQLRQRREICLDRLVEHRPARLLVVGGHRFQHVTERVDEHVVDIGAGVLVDDLGRAVLEPQRRQGGGVAAARVEQVERLALGVQAQDIGGQRVFQADGHQGLPPRLGITLEVDQAAIRLAAHRQFHRIVVVADIAGEARVFLHQLAFAGRDFDAIEVVQGVIATVVETNQNLAGDLVADAIDLGAGVLVGREVGGLERGQLHRVDVEILVATGVLQVQQALVVVGPPVLADAATTVVGHRLGRLGVAGRRQPDVQHAIDRCQPAQLLAVRRELGEGLVGIAEQLGARNQGRGGYRRRDGGSAGFGGRLFLAAGGQQGQAG